MTHLTVIDWVPPPAHYIQNIEYICMFTEDTIQDSVIWPEKKMLQNLHNYYNDVFWNLNLVKKNGKWKILWKVRKYMHLRVLKFCDFLLEAKRKTY